MIAYAFILLIIPGIIAAVLLFKPRKVTRKQWEKYNHKDVII